MSAAVTGNYEPVDHLDFEPPPEDHWDAPVDGWTPPVADPASAPADPELDPATPWAPGVPTGCDPSLLNGLNPAQADAVRALVGPVLVVAGPGSGKTRVLTHRIAALISGGIPAHRVLAVTFTNKAAAEMRERLAALVGADQARRMWVATFHSACVKILRMHHEAAGLPRAFTIVDADDAKKVLTRCATALGDLEGLSASEVRSYIKDGASTISRAKNDGRSPEDLARSRDVVVREFAPLMAAYNARLLELGAVDFDDLLLKTLHLLRTDTAVRTQLQRRWWYISVDEFQDTNAVQDEIVQLLAAAHGNVCVVGDADQSIYGFRGAQPSVMTTFATTNPHATVVVLEENYRSTPGICEVSRAVIAGNPAAHRSPLRTSNPAGDPVRLYSASDDRDEANWIVEQVKRRGAPWSGQAILVRTAALTRALEDKLKSSGIDYDVVGGLRFYDRAEVKDALSYLRLVLNPDDRLAFERAIAAPRRGVGDAGVAAIFADADTTGVSAVDAAAARAATAKGRAAAGLAEFVDSIGAIAQAATQGPAAALRAVLADTGLRAAVRAADVKENRTDYRREENLDQLVEAAAQFVTDPTQAGSDGTPVTDLSGWDQTVAWLESAALHSAGDVDTDSEDEDGARSSDRVQIMTMHSAKGKEFPHVYVAALEENVLPHSRALEEGPDGVAEERRLLFVAVSRAERTLDLSHVGMRVQFGKVVENGPSRFIDELPASVQKVTSTPTRGPSWGRHRGGRTTWQPRPAPPTTTPSAGVLRTPRVQATAPRLSGVDLREGVRVTHAMFGEGSVVEASKNVVVVAFDTVGQRTLSLAVAPLSLLED